MTVLCVVQVILLSCMALLAAALGGVLLFLERVWGLYRTVRRATRTP